MFSSKPAKVVTLLAIVLTPFAGTASAGVSPAQADPPAAPQACIPPPAGLVSWWPGDGNAQDIQGGNNGTLQNGVTFGTGEVGQAFSLDGLDDFVSVPDAPNLDIPQDITIEAWVLLPNRNTNYFIVTKQPADGSASFYPGNYEFRI